MEDLDLLSTWNVTEKGESVTEEDVAKVSENLKKAAQVWAQIRWQQAHNQNLAKLLAILLSHIDDTNLWWNINMLLDAYKVDPEIVFSFFLPFMKVYIKDKKLIEMYQLFQDVEINSLVDYSNFIKDIFSNYKTLKSLPKEIQDSIIKKYYEEFVSNWEDIDYVEFKAKHHKDYQTLILNNYYEEIINTINNIIYYFDIWDIKALDEKTLTEIRLKIKESLQQEIFW